MASGAELALKITAQDHASRVMQGVSGHLHGMAGAMAAPTKAAGGLFNALGKLGLASLGIGAAFGAAKGAAEMLGIGLASDLNETLSKSSVVFGESSKAVEDWGNKAAQAMGQSKAQAIGSAATFGNLFVSMGFAGKAASGMSMDIVGLASDLASFNNIPTADVLEKLRAGLTGESEPLKALGVNLSAAAIEAEILAQGLDTSTFELKTQAKTMATYALILKQTKTAQGDFAKTSTGMANATRIISAQFANLKTEIGSRLLPVIAPLISAFAQAMPAAMDTVTRGLDAVSNAVGIFANYMRLAWGDTTATADRLGELPGPLAAITMAIGNIIGLAPRFIGFLKDTFDSLSKNERIQTIIHLFTGWAQAIGGVAGALLKGDIGGALEKLMKGVNDWLIPLDKNIIAGIGDLAGKLTTWLGEQWANIKWEEVWKAAQGVGAAFASVAGTLFNIVGDIMGWLGTQFSNIKWADVWDAVTNVVSGIAEGLGDIVGAVTDWLGKTWAGIEWAEIWDRVTNLFTGAADIAGQVTTWLQEQWKKIDWGKVWKDAQSKLGDLLGSGLDIVSGINDWLRSQFGKADPKKIYADLPPIEGVAVSDKAKEKKNALQTFFDEIGGIIKTAGEVYGNFCEMMAGVFTRGLGLVLEAAVSGVKSLRNFLKSEDGGKGIEIDFKAIWDFVTFKSVGTWIIDAIAGMFSRIGKGISDNKESVLRPLRQLRDEIAALFNDIQRMLGIMNAIPRGGGGGGADSGGIPSFALGGTVPGPVGSPRLIVAHGGEHVIPIGRSGGGVNVTINVPGYWGSASELAATVRDELLRMKLATGDLGLS
ncbi:MAG: hypothetical protein Q7J84_03980 [Sulfuricaulis sp.]|nr:hypothetical protein [Sulfuricaulis sp.]